MQISQNNNKIKKRQNLFVIFALVFFIIYKFALNYIIWDRPLPPEPDDSYSYILYPTVIQNDGFIPPHTDTPLPSNHSDYIKAIPFNIILISLSDITGLSIELLYQLNFYFGIVFLALILIYFFDNIGRGNKYLIAIGLLTLAFYDGEGSYHGFYWIVPSFYAFAGFLFIITTLFSDSKKHLAIVLLAIPSIILIHPTFIHAILATLFFYYLFNCLLKRKIDLRMLKKIFIIVFLLLSFFVLFKTVFYFQGSKENDKSSITVAVSEMQQDKTLFHSAAWDVINNDFFRYFSLNSLYLLMLFLGLINLIKYKKYQYIILILALFSLILISPMAAYGYRFLLYLWPFIFILFAFLFYYLLFSKISGGKKYFFVILFIFFIVGECSSNFSAAIYRKERLIFSWDKKIVNYLLDNTAENEYVIYNNKYSFFTLATHGLFTRKLAYTDWDFKTINPIGKYLVLTSNNNNQEYKKKLKEMICFNNGIKCKLDYKKDGNYFQVYQIVAAN